MGLLDPLYHAIFAKEVKDKLEDMKVGKFKEAGVYAWKLIDGWKTWLWAIIQALKIAFPTLSCWGYVDAAANSIGWQHLAPAVDPGQLVTLVTGCIAVGHKAWKAYKQFKAGVPIVDLQSTIIPK